jgi:hypothetical protein
MATEVTIRSMNDRYVAALKAAGVDATVDLHAGIHDAPDFDYDLENIVKWGLFAPVDEQPTSWVDDTVASHGRLWDVGYRLDPAPDGVVRFRRAGRTLGVSGARTTASLTFANGCTARVALPATVAVPALACTPLGVAVAPKAVRAGRATTLTVTLTPAIKGAKVRIGSATASTDARGRATIRTCFATTTPQTVVVTATGRKRATARLAVRGPAHRCPGS